MKKEFLKQIDNATQEIGKDLREQFSYLTALNQLD